MTRSELFSIRTVSFVGAHLFRLGSQAVFFIAMARSIGPSGFGQFSATLALALIAAPFITLGAGGLIVRNCTLDRERLAEYVGSAYLMHVATLFAIVPMLIATQLWTNESSGVVQLFAYIIVAELVFAKAIEITSAGLQALGRANRIGLHYGIFASLRLTAVVLAYGFEREAELTWWLALYASSAGVAAIIAAADLFRQVGWPRLVFKKGKLAEGLLFSLGLSSQASYNDADKALMVKYDEAHTAGAYATSYRLVDLAFAPVRAMLALTYAGFFTAGKDGVAGTLAYARRVSPPILGLGLLGSLAVLASTPAITIVFGPAYATSAEIALWIAAIPFLRSFHFILADCLTGAGHQLLRSIIQIGFALASVIAGVFLIPIYSWKAAATISVASNTFLCFVLIAGLAVIAVKERSQETASRGPGEVLDASA